MDVLLIALDGEIDRITQEPVGRAGAADEVVGHIEPGEDLVQARKGEVGQDRPEQHGVDHERRLKVPSRSDEQPGQPQRGDGGDGEEDGVEDVVDAPGACVDLRHLGWAGLVNGRCRRAGASHLGRRHGVTLSKRRGGNARLHRTTTENGGDYHPAPRPPNPWMEGAAASGWLHWGVERHRGRERHWDYLSTRSCLSE